MNMLMATCPRCHSERDSGLFADDPTVRELGPKLQVLVLCERCRAYHRALVKELYIAEEEIAA
jgi:hypothetical protein